MDRKSKANFQFGEPSCTTSLFIRHVFSCIKKKICPEGFSLSGSSWLKDQLLLIYIVCVVNLIVQTLIYKAVLVVLDPSRLSSEIS